MFVDHQTLNDTVEAVRMGIMSPDEARQTLGICCEADGSPAYQPMMSFNLQPGMMPSEQMSLLEVEVEEVPPSFTFDQVMKMRQENIITDEQAKFLASL